MTYKVPERIYRTTDGRLVRHGDPEAAFLAYIEGEELAEEEAKRVGLAALFEKKTRTAEPEDKVRAEEPEDKAGPRLSNKAAENKGGGVTISAPRRRNG